MKREMEILDRVISILKEAFNPGKIILFGSRGKGNNSQSADFDLAIDCPKPEISVQRKIDEEIEKVSGLYQVDLAYLRSVNEEFKRIILKTGRVVYERRD